MKRTSVEVSALLQGRRFNKAMRAAIRAHLVWGWSQSDAAAHYGLHRQAVSRALWRILPVPAKVAA